MSTDSGFVLSHPIDRQRVRLHVRPQTLRGVRAHESNKGDGEP